MAQVVHGPKVSSVQTVQKPNGRSMGNATWASCERDAQAQGYDEAVVRWQLWLCGGWDDDSAHFQYLEEGKIQGYMLTTGVCSRGRRWWSGVLWPSGLGYQPCGSGDGPDLGELLPATIILT